MKIGKLHINHLRNGEHFQFHTEFKKTVNKTGADKLKIAEQFTVYLALLDKLDDGLKKVNRSTLTSKIEEADKVRDEIWSGLVEINKVSTKHFDDNVREAAERLRALFDTYGNLANKKLNEQTGLTYNIVKDLEVKYAEEMKTVGIEKWVAELKKINSTFESLMYERFEESYSKNDIIVREARLELDKTYYTITERINSFAVVADDVSIFNDFIKMWNIIVAKYGGKRISASSATDGGNTVAPPTEPAEPEDPFANAREWTRILKAGDFKLGDIFYIAEPNVPKKYYELIDEEHYNYFPNSDEGTLAWKRLV